MPWEACSHEQWQEEGFNSIWASVHIVSEKQVISFGRHPMVLDHFDESVHVAMQIAYDYQRGWNVLQEGLLCLECLPVHNHNTLSVVGCWSFCLMFDEHLQ